ncbi:MAG: hypothetical protein Q7S22_00715 [Candidatus Micrarchaeota archaeon]|nr:hypothetical protein [Candidatus Micrarchaeota archaeon]
MAGTDVTPVKNWSSIDLSNARKVVMEELTNSKDSLRIVITSTDNWSFKITISALLYDGRTRKFMESEGQTGIVNLSQLSHILPEFSKIYEAQFYPNYKFGQNEQLQIQMSGETALNLEVLSKSTDRYSDRWNKEYANLRREIKTVILNTVTNEERYVSFDKYIILTKKEPTEAKKRAIA